MQQNAAMSQSFSSQPMAVAATRKKFREPGEAGSSGVYRDLKETAIHWDKRVHRGNTYGLYTQNAIKEALADAMGEGGPAAAPRKKRSKPDASPFDMPLPEKERIPVDLTKHLVAKEEEIKHETVEAQTDEFLPEPPAEQYQPQKTGMDVMTQVEDGELFDFEYEVEPILDVLINKTLEQSLMETEEEDEMERMKQFQSEWFERQAKMMKTWEEQLAEEWVRWRAKEKVLAEAREKKKREATVLLKIQAMSAATKHLANVVPNAVSDLQELAFPDKKGMDLHRDFLPMLFQQAQKQAQSFVNARQHVDQVVADAARSQVQAQHAGFAAHASRTREIRKQRFAEVQIRRGRIRILVDGRVVGPVEISSKDTIEQIQGKIHAWLQVNEATMAAEYSHGVTLCLDGEPLKAGQEAEIFASKPVGEATRQISMRPKLQAPPEVPAAEVEGVDGAEADGG